MKQTLIEAGDLLTLINSYTADCSRFGKVF